jgi:translation elongation factor EF-Tu-like GTPase
MTATVSVYVEAMLLLLPREAGGRTAPVAPREGSYRPFARLGDRTTRALLLEGPPLLAPGDAARVMLELEVDAATSVERTIDAGTELQLLEHDERVVGTVTVLRVCRRATFV